MSDTDLTDLQAAETVKIVGCNALGQETNPLQVSGNYEALTSDACSNGGVYSELTVGLTAVELRVGSFPLSLRKLVTMQARDKGIFWGYSNAVTVSSGTEIFKRQTIILPIGSGTSVWLIASSAGLKVRIGEIA